MIAARRECQVTARLSGILNLQRCCLMGLTLEILGLVVFLGTHVFVTMRDRRAAVVAQIGEWPYRALFSLVSIIGIVLIAYGFAVYRTTGWIDVWYLFYNQVCSIGRHITYCLDRDADVGSGLWWNLQDERIGSIAWSGVPLSYDRPGEADRDGRHHSDSDNDDQRDLEKMPFLARRCISGRVVARRGSYRGVPC